MEALSYKKMDFEEFCAAAISVYQLEVHPEWDRIATTAFEYFEETGNRVISVEELAQVRKFLFFFFFLSFKLFNNPLTF